MYSLVLDVLFLCPFWFLCLPYCYLIMETLQFLMRNFLGFVGPGFLVSLAYVDLGNLETDLQATGSSHGYEKSFTNAFRLYSKTKPLPSKEPIKRVKDLPCEGVHPIFKNVLEGGELTTLVFSERLKTFRPKQTIQEAEGEAARSKHAQGPASQWVDEMKKKRSVYEGSLIWCMNSVLERVQSRFYSFERRRCKITEDIVKAVICVKELEAADDRLQDYINPEELDFKRLALESEDEIQNLTTN